MDSLNKIALVCFVISIFHTFMVKQIHHQASRFPKDSLFARLILLFSEVELVFIVWSLVLIFAAFVAGVGSDLISYLSSLHFHEPIFVFFIMLFCSARPVLRVVEIAIIKTSELMQKLFGCSFGISAYLTAMILGPLLGSFVTEPAAMTVTAYFLLKHFFNKGITMRLKYASIGLLFVNISIGGVLTPYAAPPVLMVAQKWNWGLYHMLTQFGWRATISILLSTLVIVLIFKDELKKIEEEEVAVKYQSHSLIWKDFFSSLKFRDPLMVSLFLAGLVIIGGAQKWWVQPIIEGLSVSALYLSSTALTSIVDNAALTYLGAQSNALTEGMKYALVAGSVVGGGLTIIANAPNPVGYSILKNTFGTEGMGPLRLFLYAFMPTLIAFMVFGLGVL